MGWIDNFFNCPGCRIFILCEIHCYLCLPKSWHNNSFLGSVWRSTEEMSRPSTYFWWNSFCSSIFFRFNFVFTRILTILLTRLVILPKDMKKYFFKLQEFCKKNAPLELEIIVKHIDQWTWKDTSLKVLKLNYRK